MPLWTTPAEDELLLRAHGQSDLARPLIAALALRPDLVIIVSDGVDNAPAAGAAEVARVSRARGLSAAPIVHLNPAFEGEDLTPRTLGGPIPSVGIRDAESLFVVLEFARFALGSATLPELEQLLAKRIATFIGPSQLETSHHVEDA